METFNLPKNPTTLIFDIDGTLYTSAEFVQEQIDVQIRHWADINGMTHEEARKKIADFRKKYAAENDGKKISLGNVFLNFGVDIDTSIRWRIELLKPENFLKPNAELKAALEKAAENFNLIAVTNNPVEAARKTLAVLGLDKIIPEIIGLDTCKKSKPAKEILDLALEHTGAKAEECISIGDRYDIDLSLPVKMGMGGVLVNGAEEVVQFINSIL